jgi:hypothetical protein
VLGRGNTVLAFCLDTKKRERGRRQPAYYRRESRIVSKQTASSVFMNVSYYNRCHDNTVLGRYTIILDGKFASG